MSEKHPCEISVIQYVPNLIRNEPVNVGVVIVENRGSDGFHSSVRFTENLSSLLCRSPFLDVSIVRGEIRKMETFLMNVVDLDPNQIPEDLPNLRFGHHQKLLTLSMEKELRRSMVEYVQIANTRPRKSTERERVLSEIKQSFESYGLLNLLRANVPISELMGTTDPFCFDFGYETESLTHLLTAQTLKRDLSRAQLLGHTCAKLKAEWERLSKDLKITAIIEELPHESTLDLKHVSEFWSDQEIRTVTVEELPQLAEAIANDVRFAQAHS